MADMFAYEYHDAVLAALAKFTDDFNQEQVHVRQSTKGKAGTEYPDGSYATPTYRWTLKEALTRKDIEKVVSKSGLYGLTFGDDFVEAYYVGDPTDGRSIGEFEAAAGRVEDLIGASGGENRRSAARLWPYGDSSRELGYERIRGDVPAGEGTSNETAKRVAGYLNATVGKGGKRKVAVSMKLRVPPYW